MDRIRNINAFLKKLKGGYLSMTLNRFENNCKKLKKDPVKVSEFLLEKDLIKFIYPDDDGNPQHVEFKGWYHGE